MEQIVYDPTQDLQPDDKFAPCSVGSDVLHLPKDVAVKFIGQESDVISLRQMIGKPFIGMDSEWRPQMTKFENMRPALLQLSD
jgi:hypothetical protein